jgi:putative hydrolase of the HAD superfamily
MFIAKARRTLPSRNGTDRLDYRRLRPAAHTREVTDAVVLWDFDGTLARRPGLWSGCVLEVLDEHVPGHTGTTQGIREDLRGGFPWHRPDRAHPELCDAEAWWEAMLSPIAAAIERCGVQSQSAPELARHVRRRFVDGSRGWEAFADSRGALESTRRAGWRNVVLSNHVPELEELVRHVGLDDLIERVFCSAHTGFEKPHPRAFLDALDACGQPRLRWMVGDNPAADVAGAESLGIPAVLIRSTQEARRRCSDASQAAGLIIETGSP